MIIETHITDSTPQGSNSGGTALITPLTVNNSTLGNPSTSMNITVDYVNLVIFANQT